MDEARLRKMMERTHTDAFGWALYCCRGDREAAADLLQSVYLSILQSRARFEGRSSFKTWIFSIIRHSAARRVRILQRAREFLNGRVQLAGARAASQEAAVYGGELRDRISALLGSLSVRQEQVLRLVFYHGLTLEESAQVMRVSIGSARTHYDRGKKRLRQALEESGLNDEITQGRYGNQAIV